MNAHARRFLPERGSDPRAQVRRPSCAWRPGTAIRGQVMCHSLASHARLPPTPVVNRESLSVAGPQSGRHAHRPVGNDASAALGNYVSDNSTGLGSAMGLGGSMGLGSSIGLGDSMSADMLATADG